MSQIRLKNIFLLFGIAVILIFAGIFFYQAKSQSLTTVAESVQTEDPRNHDPVLLTSEYYENSTTPKISAFYKKYPNSKYKVRYADEVDTAPDALSSGPYKFELGNIDNQGTKVLNYTALAESYSEWDQNYEISHDGRFFVNTTTLPESNTISIEFYDFEQNNFYAVDNSEYTKRMNEIMSEGKVYPGQLGANIFFNPTIKYVAVSTLEEVDAYTNVWSIFVFKINTDEKRLEQVFHQDFPETQYIKIKGWDPLKPNELHFAQYQTELLGDEKWMSYDKNTGQSKYIDASESPISIKTANKNDLNYSWADSYVTDYEYSETKVINDENSQEYADFLTAVEEDFRYHYIGAHVIYPLDITFSEGTKSELREDPLY
jgi:hypothetical protein